MTLEDVVKPKPSPEGLKKIINDFNFKKREIFMLGIPYMIFKQQNLQKLIIYNVIGVFKKYTKKIFLK